MLNEVINKWERLNNPEVMGYVTASKADDVANFFNNISLVSYDTYTAHNFGRYIEGMLRGYQSNNQVHDEIHLSTTYDLHNVTFSSYSLYDFEYYLSNIWKEEFIFALENGI